MTETTTAPQPYVLKAASLLPALFEEQKRGDYQAREAVFTTFNADLGFFERTVLGVAQATGARITVVGDAHVWDPDPRAARNAGTRYLPSVAIHPGAFHPKVNVVVGRTRALVSIGSGNLSPGGWHLNDELWTIARIDAEGCPDFVAETADWLRRVPDFVTMSAEAALGLRRAAADLEVLAASAPLLDTDSRLVHTLDWPIIEQLPAGPVETLSVYAPFHDPACAALRALIERHTPATLQVAVQGDFQTSVDPAALADVLAWAREAHGTDGHVLQGPAGRYRHGKVVEATRHDGSRWTLTGSPNISRAAMLLRAAAGGNIEVGLITENGPSLFPGGEPVTVQNINARIPESPADGSTDPVGPVLLSAVQQSDGHVEVRFGRETAMPCVLQASAQFAYDTWRDVAEVPAGSTVVAVDSNLRPGSRIRVAWIGDDGTLLHGSTHFVVDPMRVMQRAADSTGSTRSHVPDPFLIITDPRLADLWLSGLSQLASAQAQIALPVATGGAAPKGETDESPTPGRFLPDDEHSWLTYQDDAKARLGPAMFAFALGGVSAVSALDRTTAGLTLQVPTDVLVDESAAGLDDDDADTVNDDTDALAAGDLPTGDEQPSTEGARDDVQQRMDAARAAREKSKMRARLTRAIREQAPHHAAIDRSAIVLLTFVAVHADVWPQPHGRDGWAPVVADALGILEHRTADGVSDIPERIASNVGSLAAIGLYMLHDALQEVEDATEMRRYRDAVGAVAHLLPDASEACISEYVAPMRNLNGFPVDPDSVLAVALSALDDAPLAAIVDQIETAHPERVAHAHSAQEIHVIDQTARNAMLVAAEALSVLAVDQGIAWAAVGTDRDGRSCLLIRWGAHLLAFDDIRHEVRFERYLLTTMVTPVAVARDNDTRLRVRVRAGQKTAESIPAVEDVLAAVRRTQMPSSLSCTSE